MGVWLPLPTVRNDIVTPRHLLLVAVNVDVQLVGVMAVVVIVSEFVAGSDVLYAVVVSALLAVLTVLTVLTVFAVVPVDGRERY